ncbi:MAG: hypothetical protein AABM29_00345 [Actinomycetota bacterium]
MSGPANQEVPEGSVAVGNVVRLPRGAEPPIEVFVNGVPQTEGTDYTVRGGREIVFARQILKEGRVGAMRWLAMFIGLFGTYRKDETVDVQFTRAGKVELASDVQVVPDEHAAPPPHGGRAH